MGQLQESKLFGFVNSDDTNRQIPPMAPFGEKARFNAEVLLAPMYILDRYRLFRITHTRGNLANHLGHFPSLLPNTFSVMN